MIENGAMVDIIRLITGALILSYASYTDIKTRKASNILWLIMGVIGGILLLVQYFIIGFDNVYILIFIPILMAMWYVFFQLRLIFGGADAKALMAITILVPTVPQIFGYPLWSYALPFNFVIFANSVILFLFIPLGLFVYNLIRRDIELPFCFLGYKMSVEQAKQSFVWPLEKIKNGKRKFAYMPKDFNIESQLKIFEIKGIKEIWVTPKIPFMIPLLAGFISSFFVGDIMSYIVQNIMSIF